MIFNFLYDFFKHFHAYVVTITQFIFDVTLSLFDIERLSSGFFLRQFPKMSLSLVIPSEASFWQPLSAWQPDVTPILSGDRQRYMER